MSLIRRTSPFSEMLSLRQAMDRLFEDSFVRPRSFLVETGQERWLPLDVHATPDALIVEAALPGVRPEDVDITVTGDALTISGTTHQAVDDEGRDFLYREIRRGSVTRTVTLPADLRPDAATAVFENGMLRLTIPKAEASKPRQIRVSTGSDAQRAAPVGDPVAVGTADGNGR